MDNDDHFLLTLTLEDKKSTYKFEELLLIGEQEQVKKIRILMQLAASALIPRVCLFVEECCHPTLFKCLKNMKNLKEVKIINYYFYYFFNSKYLFH